MNVVEDNKICDHFGQGTYLGLVTYMNYYPLGPVKVKLAYKFWMGAKSYDENGRAYVHGATGCAHYRHYSAVSHLRDASDTAGLEIDPIFFTRCHFYFDHPLGRLQFLDRLNMTSILKNGLRFHIKLFPTGVGRVELEENNEDWIHAFGWLPRNLRSIDFTFGKRDPRCISERTCFLCDLYGNPTFHMDEEDQA